MEAHTPILVVEGLDVLAFSSVESAQRHLEPWWIKEDRGRIYDASGHRMTAVCHGQRVVLSVGDASVAQEEELSAALRAHFRATAKPAFADEKSLSQLIAAIPVR